MDWRLLVNDPSDSPLFEYGPNGADGDGGIAAFPSFDIDVSGNCLTMSFTAVPKLASIYPRDLVTLERYDTSTSTWVPWWKGVVTTAGTPLSDEPQQYQALGLKQVFYERVLLTNRWPNPPALSTDAANLPDFATAITTIPAVTIDSTSAPALGLDVGVVLPNRQSFGDFLDARARQVGTFIVPISESYAYDGVTFAAGDVVPEVRWGADPTGRFFFRRVGVNEFPQLQVNEDDSNVEVTWSPYTSEGKSNSFTFVLLAGVDRERLLSARVNQAYSGPPEFDESFVSTEQTFIPYTASGPSPTPADPIVEQTIAVENPLDYMLRENMTFLSNALWSDIPDAVDGNVNTFAQYGQTFTAISATGGTETTVGDWKIHTFTSGGTFTVSNAGSNPEVEYLIVAGGGGGAYAASSVSGGGGAGGMLSGLATVTATNYTITVGSGGSGATASTNPTSGGNSSAFSVTATGGGRGPTSTNLNGGAGGSGGGARGISGQGNGTGGSGTAGQGNNGGNASSASSPIAFSSAAGGGGAGGAAANSNSTNTATVGGIGLASTITGSAVTYATGGDGRASSGGGVSGAANTGNGGGGGVGVNGGAGGSGVVIIRYRTTSPNPVRAAGTSFDFGSPAILQSDPVSAGPGAFVVWYSSDAPVAFAIRRQGLLTGSTTIGSTSYSYDIDTTMELQFEYQATNTDTEIRPRQIVLPALAPTTIGRNDLSGDDNTLFILGVDNLRIHDCAWYEADVELIQRVAESLVREQVTEAAVVTVNGYEPIASSVEVGSILSGAVTMNVERVEYTLTTEAGVQTKFYAGQRFDPALQTESIVINNLVRRLTSTKDSV